MKTCDLTLRAAALAVAASLAACGGGGDDTATSNSPPPASASATPTASIQGDSASAQALVAATKTSTASLGKMQAIDESLSDLMVPPAQVSGSGSGPCPAGGSASYTLHMASTTQFTTGDSYTRTLSNCALVAGTSFSGSMSYLMTRMVSPTNWAVDVQASNWTRTTAGRTYGPLNMSVHLDVMGNAVSYAFAVDGATIVGLPTMSVVGSNVSIGTGTLRAVLGGGWAEMAYTGWVFNPATGVPVSGSVTVRAANGNTANITVVGSNYQVVLTVNGVVTTHLVPLVTPGG